MPPHTHRSNAAEHAIRAFKAHFLSILAGVAPDFPINIWDLLLPQAELTLNLLRQATINPSQSAWSYFHGAFNYDAITISTLGCDIIEHRKTVTRNFWDFCSVAGWYVGVSLQHYHCHIIVAKATRAVQISDMVEFRHQHLTQTKVTPMDRIVHGANTLTCALKDAPQIACDNHLFAIRGLQQAFQRWTTTTTAPRAQPHPILRNICPPREDKPPAPPPWVVIPKPPTPLPRVVIPKPPDKPVPRSLEEPNS